MIQPTNVTARLRPLFTTKVIHAYGSTENLPLATLAEQQRSDASNLLIFYCLALETKFNG